MIDRRRAQPRSFRFIYPAHMPLTSGYEWRCQFMHQHHAPTLLLGITWARTGEPYVRFALLRNDARITWRHHGHPASAHCPNILNPKPSPSFPSALHPCRMGFLSVITRIHAESPIHVSCCCWFAVTIELPFVMLDALGRLQPHSSRKLLC
jgi:hypothetical protein